MSKNGENFPSDPDLIINDGSNKKNRKTRKKPQVNKSSEETESIIVGRKPPENSPIASDDSDHRFHLLDQTAEERVDIQWQGKQNKKREKASQDPLGRTGRRNFSRQADKGRSSTRRSPARKRIPLHYYLIFYGFPLACILLLIFLAVNYTQGNGGNSQNSIQTVDLQEMWTKSQQLAAKYSPLFKEGKMLLEQKKWPQAREKLRNCKELLQAAIAEGEKVWQQQIQLVAREKNIAPEKAARVTYERYGGYRQQIDQWKEQLQTVKQHLAKLPEKK